MRFKQTAAIFEWNSSWLHMHYFKFYCTFLAKFPEPRDFKLAHYLICMVMPLFHSSNSHTIFTRGTRPPVMECSFSQPIRQHTRGSENVNTCARPNVTRGANEHGAWRRRVTWPALLSSHMTGARTQSRHGLFLAWSGEKGNSSRCTLSTCMHCTFFILHCIEEERSLRNWKFAKKINLLY